MFYILLCCFLFLILGKLFFIVTTGVCRCQKCLIGKVAIVTGGSQGIGFYTALNLASRGCKVIIADITDPEAAKHKIIQTTNNHNIIAKYVDYSSFSSVRSFAKYINENVVKVDILINNVGCYQQEITSTKDGFLTMMQVNYFSHFLLIHLLLDLIKKSKTRIVLLSSCVNILHRIKSCKDLCTKPNINKYIDGVILYSNTKVLMAITAKLLADKLKPYGITCVSVNPGFSDTGILVNWRFTTSNYNRIHYFGVTFYRLLIAGYAKAPVDAAWPVLHCAIADSVDSKSGSYYWECIKFPLPLIARNKDLCFKIWTETEKIVQLKDEEKIVEENML